MTIEEANEVVKQMISGASSPFTKLFIFNYWEYLNKRHNFPPLRSNSNAVETYHQIVAQNRLTTLYNQVTLEGGN
jgi:hypothetical protein